MNETRQTPPIVEWARQRTTSLADRYGAGDPTATAAIAQLRKCADGQLHSDPDLLQWTLEGLPYTPEREWAASLTLGLFATVQRGNRSGSCQNADIPFMQAIANMAQTKPEWANGILRQRRFIDQTDIPESLAHRLTGLARRMNTVEAACDWGWMAYRLQQWADPHTRNLARLQWSREYIITKKPNKK